MLRKKKITKEKKIGERWHSVRTTKETAKSPVNQDNLRGTELAERLLLFIPSFTTSLLNGIVQVNSTPVAISSTLTQLSL